MHVWGARTRPSTTGLSDSVIVRLLLGDQKQAEWLGSSAHREEPLDLFCPETKGDVN